MEEVEVLPKDISKKSQISWSALSVVCCFILLLSIAIIIFSVFAFIKPKLIPRIVFIFCPIVFLLLMILCIVAIVIVTKD